VICKSNHANPPTWFQFYPAEVVSQVPLPPDSSYVPAIEERYKIEVKLPKAMIFIHSTKLMKYYSIHVEKSESRT
jgi:hypothetical protein